MASCAAVDGTRGEIFAASPVTWQSEWKRVPIEPIPTCGHNWPQCLSGRLTLETEKREEAVRLWSGGDMQCNVWYSRLARSNPPLGCLWQLWRSASTGTQPFHPDVYVFAYVVYLNCKHSSQQLYSLYVQLCKALIFPNSRETTSQAQHICDHGCRFCHSALCLIAVSDCQSYLTLYLSCKPLIKWLFKRVSIQACLHSPTPLCIAWSASHDISELMPCNQ